MTKYFAGNSLAAFSRSAGAIFDGDTTAGRFDPAYVSGAIFLGAGTAAFIRTPEFSATGSVWVRYDLYINDSGSNGAVYFQLNNGATPVFRFRTSNSTFIFWPEYWTSGAWASAGSNFTVPNGSLVTIVARIDLNGGFEAFLNGTSVASGSGWAGGQTTVTNAQFFPGNNATSVSSTATRISQIMIADYDIRDSHFLIPAINGNSAVNTGQLSGSYTDVNEVPTNDANAILIDTIGNKAGQTKAAITVPVGFGISAGVINGRGRVSGGVVTDGKLGWRSGGANYSSAALGYNGGYEPRGVINEANPATGGAWNQTSFNAAEIYEEAA